VSPETVLGLEKNQHLPPISVYPRLEAILDIVIAAKTPADFNLGQKYVGNFRRLAVPAGRVLGMGCGKKKHKNGLSMTRMIEFRADK